VSQQRDVAGDATGQTACRQATKGRYHVMQNQ
jgi:hypothetical protein